MKDSKNIETYLMQLMCGVEINNIDVYTETAKCIFQHLKNSGIQTYKTPHKPKVKSNPTYSKKSEPKTDILFWDDTQKWKLSIKKDDSAYIVSCNSPDDFKTMFIDIFNGREILDDEMISQLEETSLKIDKISNFYSFDKTYKGNVELFVKDKFVPKASRFVGTTKALEYSSYIVDCYKDTNLRNQYITNLNVAESFLQDTLTKLFRKYPEYSKQIIFELITGNVKFQNSDCSCNCLADISGFYLLDSPNCEYVTQTYNKFLNSPKIGRLQNVPRKYIKKKTLLTMNRQTIAEEFAVADLTFKL